MEGKKVKLTSADGKEFEVPLAVARQSVTIRNMLDGLCVHFSEIFLQLRMPVDFFLPV